MIDNLNKIKHNAAIYALAISPNEKWIACGGWHTGSITIWDLQTGLLLTQLSGFTDQVQSLTFSNDSKKIAAANVWGGIWVWDIDTALLIQHKEQSKTRRLRSLTFSSIAKKEFPIMLSDSMFGGHTRALAPNGKWLAISRGELCIMNYKTTTELFRLEYHKYDIAKTGVGYMKWSSDSNLLAMSGDGWVGLWMPNEGYFFGCQLPFSDFVYCFDWFIKTNRIDYW